MRLYQLFFVVMLLFSNSVAHSAGEAVISSHPTGGGITSMESMPHFTQDKSQGEMGAHQHMAHHDGNSHHHSWLSALSSKVEVSTVLWLFFVSGLLMAFTPCLLPILPILANVLQRQTQQSAVRGLTVTLVYVVGMTLFYIFLGFTAAIFGTTLNLDQLFNSPIAHRVTAIVFVILAVSMMGMFDMFRGVPWRLKKIDIDNNVAYSLPKALLMGGMSGLVLSPCMGPMLIAMLLFISLQTQPLVGAAALGLHGLGMGLPLLVIGLTSGRLFTRFNRYSRYVKVFFGLCLLAVAIWLLLLDLSY